MHKSLLQLTVGSVSCVFWSWLSPLVFFICTSIMLGRRKHSLLYSSSGFLGETLARTGRTCLYVHEMHVLDVLVYMYMKCVKRSESCIDGHNNSQFSKKKPKSSSSASLEKYVLVFHDPFLLTLSSLKCCQAVYVLCQSSKHI